MSNYHEAFKKSESKRAQQRAPLPAGLKVKRRDRSSLDTPLFRFLKSLFFVAIAVGCISTVVLFFLSFMNEKTPTEQTKQLNSDAFMNVDVKIGFKGTSQDTAKQNK